MNKLGIWGIIIVTFFLIFTALSPAAHAANANLFVSAENSQFSNFMAGPMVIEVKIVDPDIDETNEAKGEPEVTVNGKILRMVQAVDGNWYGYFADRLQAVTADATTVDGALFGLQFGEFCSATSASVVGSVDFSKTNGVAFPTDGAAGSTEGTAGTSLGTCTGAGTPEMTTTTDGSETYDGMPVVREPKDVVNPSGAGTVATGQIGIEENFWPFIQLYTLNPTGNVVIQYNKGGGAQTTTLTFDTVDQFAGLELNKVVYLKNEGVLVTITDLQLNIDPTSKDSWTWGTATSAFYRLFDENGQGEADGTAGAVDLLPFQSQMMFRDNGVLTLQKDDLGTQVVLLRDNDIQELDGIDGPTSGGSISAADQPVTFLETKPNSGVFVNFDDSNSANIAVTSDAGFRMEAIINYNKNPVPIEVSVDEDGDGLAFDIDCDDNDAAIGIADTWYRDLDGDGFGDLSNSQEACTMPAGFVSDNTDCNDDDSAINPSATDIPDDGIDQDCDGADAEISSSAILDAINTLSSLVLDSLGQILDLLQNPEFGLGEIKREISSMETKIDELELEIEETKERVSVTVSFDDDDELKQGKVVVLLDTTDSGTLSVVHVAANLPCKSSKGPTDGAGNDTPDVKIIAGNAETGIFGDVIESAVDDTGFEGQGKTCVFHGTLRPNVDVPEITDVVLINEGSDDDKKDNKNVKLKDVVVTITGTYE